MRLACVAGIMVLSSAAMAGSAIPSLDVVVRNDASVEIEGGRYRTADSLKPKIAEINARQPAVHLHVKAPPDMPFRTMSDALLMLLRAGAHVSVGFVTEPRRL